MAKTKEIDRPASTYAHMCRDDHPQIGHNDGEQELCPLCRARSLLQRVEDEWGDGEYLTTALLGAIRDELDSDR